MLKSYILFLKLFQEKNSLLLSTYCCCYRSIKLKRKCIFKKNFIVYIRIKINHFQYAISNHIANKRENKKKNYTSTFEEKSIFSFST